MSIGVLLSNPWGNMYDREYHKTSSNISNTDVQRFTQTGYANQNPSVHTEKSAEQAAAPLHYAKSSALFFKEEDTLLDTAANDSPISLEAINQLFVNLDESDRLKVGYTKTTFSSSDPKKSDKVFYTLYSPEGIRCIREGERNVENPEEKIGEDKLQWEIKFDSPDQYDKLNQFLSRFPEGDDLRFTTKEVFWKDFFADEIDMDGFMDFYAWTDRGKPNFAMEENGVAMRERMTDPNAKYFNDQTWIARVWTEEEMWAMWYARIEASSAAQKAVDSIPVGGSVTEENRILFAEALDSENRYFKYADERGIIDYKGIVFYCDTETDTLKLGDCSNPSNCIQIPLAEGGSLMVNRDNLDQLFDALSFFSPEDMAMILQILQKEKMSKDSLMEMDQEEDKILALLKDRDANNKKTAKDYREQAFKQIGINAPDEVKQAWLDAADAAGMDGMGISDVGALDHIPQFLIQRWIRGIKGEDIYDVLGNSVQSAIRAANDALYALNNPLEPNRSRTPEERKNREKEKIFYEEFLKRLEIFS